MTVELISNPINRCAQHRGPDKRIKGVRNDKSGGSCFMLDS